MVTAARIEEMRLAAARAQLRRGGLDRPGPEGAKRRPHVAAALGRVARAVFRRGTTRAPIQAMNMTERADRHQDEARIVSGLDPNHQSRLQEPPATREVLAIAGARDPAIASPLQDANRHAVRETHVPTHHRERLACPIPKHDTPRGY
jgi:hypothetical protein